MGQIVHSKGHLTSRLRVEYHGIANIMGIDNPGSDIPDFIDRRPFNQSKSTKLHNPLEETRVSLDTLQLGFEVNTEMGQEKWVVG